MYTQSIPFKDYNDKPRNMTVRLNLDEREIFTHLAEFTRIFKWRDSLIEGEDRELGTEEVVDFYTDLEEILLSAWGELSDDGLYFDKSDRHRYQYSALFNACMVLFLSDPAAANKMLDGLMPKGLEELIRKAEANVGNTDGTNGEGLSKQEQLQAELVRLRAENLAAKGGHNAPAS